MNSNPRGDNTSHSEVTSVEASDFWLLVNDKEYFVSFDEYPVFHGAAVSEIFNLVQVSPTQFQWPDLDADIELEALEQPERFPLVFRREGSESALSEVMRRKSS